MDEFCEIFGCQVYRCKNKATGSIGLLVKDMYVIFYTCSEHTDKSDPLVKKLEELNEM